MIMVNFMCGKVTRLYKWLEPILRPGPRNQLGPRYEGQLILMAEPIPHPKRPPCMPSRRSSFFASNRRAEADSSF